MIAQPQPIPLSRRRLLTGTAAAAAVGAFGGAAMAPSVAHAVGDGFGLRIVSPPNSHGGRLHYHRFATDAIEWDPAVNVLLPDGYHTSGKRYPVLYLLHGGAQDFREFHLHQNIVNLTAGREIIVVMPDAGTGWYCNPSGHSWVHVTGNNSTCTNCCRGSTRTFVPSPNTTDARWLAFRWAASVH